jgi:hypothetical protein
MALTSPSTGNCRPAAADRNRARDRRTRGSDRVGLASGPWDPAVGLPESTSQPLFLLPGQTGTIQVTFTVPASATTGSTDSGDVWVETFNPYLPGDLLYSSDVLTAVLYSWTVS